MLARFDSVDLSEEWVLHTKFMPLPDPWREAGTVAATVMNVNTYTGAGSKWFTADHYLDVDKPSEETIKQPTQTDAEQIDTAKLVSAALQGQY